MSFRWLAVLLFPLALQAAPMETMAWHFPTMPRLDSFYKDAALTEPPTATTAFTSCFTGKDDKLKDLSAPFRTYFHLGPDSWLVWNESRKLLVGHAMPITLWQVEAESAFKRQPVLLATTVTWYQDIEPGKPVPADAKPVHRTTLVGRSGQKASQVWGTSESTKLQSVKLEIESTYGGNDYTDSNLKVDSRYSIDWSERPPRVNGNTYKWNCVSSATLESNPVRPQILTQVDSPAGGSWTLTAETSVLLYDGQPLANCRLKEVNGEEVKSTAYPKFIATKQAAKLPTSKGELLIQLFPGTDLLGAIGGSPAGEVDPFPSGGSSQPDVIETMARITSIPEELKPWFPQYMIDLKDKIKACGIQAPEGALIGFDPNSGWLFVAGLDAIELDKLDQLTAFGCDLQPNMVGVLETLVATHKSEGNHVDRAFMTGRSGQKFSLSCNTDTNESLIELELEPTIGDSDELVDLRLFSKRAAPLHESNSSLSLPCGVPVTSSSSTTESGSQVTESFQATIARLPNGDKSAEGSDSSD